MGKALRMPLGWIAVLSGYEATPAEEMPAKDDVPFRDRPAVEDGVGGASDTGAAQGSSPKGDSGNQQTSTGGPGFALEAKVTELLELTAAVSEQAHEATVDAIAKRREAGQLTDRWLTSCIKKARESLPADDEQESMFAAMVPEDVKGA